LLLKGLLPMFTREWRAAEWAVLDPLYCLARKITYPSRYP
jgi:hypothetical protein